MRPSLLLPILAATAFAAPVASPEDRVPPNIVLVLADDLGYGDLGSYGQRRFETPRLDRMAAEGMRFTQFYAGSPVCAPSRCTLLTGLHTGHARIRGNGTPDGRPVALFAEDRTIAEVLRERGYTTACIGKWGLGEAGSTGVPGAQGFDYFYGFLNQVHAHYHYPRTLWRNDTEIAIEGNDPDLQHGTPAQSLFTDEALRYIRAHAAAPFFLYLPYTVPHAELAAPEAEIEANTRQDFAPETPFAKQHYGAQARPRAAFAAMVSALDRDVGRILDLLDELGLAKNTLVLFSSDNGPHREGGHDPDFFDSNGPLRGIKRDVYDGGIRVPLLARWPGVVPPGAISTHVAAFWDLLPTCADLAGAATPPGLDGISLAPTLRGDPGQRAHEALYWEFYEQGGRQALRAGDWKAVRMNVLKDADAPLEIYNLTADPGETRNLASTDPQTARRLREVMRGAHTSSPDFSLPTP